jgi:hypothetical protein
VPTTLGRSGATEIRNGSGSSPPRRAGRHRRDPIELARICVINPTISRTRAARPVSVSLAVLAPLYWGHAADSRNSRIGFPELALKVEREQTVFARNDHPGCVGAQSAQTVLHHRGSHRLLARPEGRTLVAVGRGATRLPPAPARHHRDAPGPRPPRRLGRAGRVGRMRPRRELDVFFTARPAGGSAPRDV